MTLPVMSYKSWKTLWFCCFLTAITIASGCNQRELRGRGLPSPDGKTYLVVEDANGGGGPIIVDGKRWPHSIHAPGVIAPGHHVIACGGEIGFVIKEGHTFYFDYWGP